MTSDAPTATLDQLRQIIRGYGSALVAYSGGVDSAVVLRIAHDELGDRALGCIGKSPAYPDSELNVALALAREHALPVRVIETREHLDPRYAANTGDRCLHCRSHLFTHLREIADADGFSHILDGVHADDVHDHAGGIAAARQHGVRSPLLEAGIGKPTVRQVARQLGLGVWEKPAMACLASRIPVGTPVTLPLLERIEQAERVLADLGFQNFRIRHHGNLVRIEVTESDFAGLILNRAAIVEPLRRLGYEHVTLDLRQRS